jgi:NAD(P)-dependent dehydrogenase (short-subunit alcohol dehydrogenase family)
MSVNVPGNSAGNMQEKLFDLSGKIALITGAGANGGIGHALALGFSRYGATVIAADIDEEGTKTTTAEITEGGGRPTSFRCDIANPEEVDRLYAWVDDRSTCLKGLFKH